MKRPHKSGPILTIGNKLYAFGGINSNDNSYTTQTTYYDEATGSWEDAPPGFNFPTDKYQNGEVKTYPAMVPFSEKDVFVMGGESSVQVVQAVYHFDASSTGKVTDSRIRLPD